MEHRRVSRGVNAYPDVGEIVLVVGDEKNRAEWRRGKVVELIKGKDNVVRRVQILTKGHTIERPLSLVCSLEIKSTAVENSQAKKSGSRGKFEGAKRKNSRQATKDTRGKILQWAQEEED